MTTGPLLLRPTDLQRLQQLLRDHLPGVTAWAYGSRVNGQAHEASDLDLVLRSPDLSQIPSAALGEFLEALRESSIPILVDARDWARLPEAFHTDILRSYVVVLEGETVGGPGQSASSARMNASPCNRP